MPHLCFDYKHLISNIIIFEIPTYICETHSNSVRTLATMTTVSRPFFFVQRVTVELYFYTHVITGYIYFFHP